MRAPITIWRYVLTDAAKHTVLALSGLCIVIVVVLLTRRIDELLAAGVGLATCARLAVAIIPTYLALALPTATAFGAILTLSRMSADGEILGLRAAGIGVAQLVWPLLALGLIGAGACAYVTFDLERRSNHHMKTLMLDALKSNALVAPGRLRGVCDTQAIYVEALGDADCPLRGVFMGDTNDASAPYYVSARCGEIIDAPTSDGSLVLDMRDGTIELGGAGAYYRRASFDRAKAHLDLSRTLFQPKRLQHYLMWELIDDVPGDRFSRGEIAAELHRRVAVPVGVLLASLIGLPLGLVSPRAGRPAGAAMALAIMGPYWIAVGAAELLASGLGALAPVAVWTPNLALAVLLGALLRRARRVAD